MLAEVSVDKDSIDMIKNRIFVDLKKDSQEKFGMDSEPRLYSNTIPEDICNPLPPVTPLTVDQVRQYSSHNSRVDLYKYVILKDGQLITTEPYSDLMPLTPTELSRFSQYPTNSNLIRYRGEFYTFIKMNEMEYIIYNVDGKIPKGKLIALAHPEIANLQDVVAAGDFYVGKEIIVKSEGINNYTGHYLCYSDDYLPALVEHVFIKHGFYEAKGRFNRSLAKELKLLQFQAEAIVKNRGQSMIKITESLLKQNKSTPLNGYFKNRHVVDYKIDNFNKYGITEYPPLFENLLYEDINDAKPPIKRLSIDDIRKYNREGKRYVLKYVILDNIGTSELIVTDMFSQLMDLTREELANIPKYSSPLNDEYREFIEINGKDYPYHIMDSKSLAIYNTESRLPIGKVIVLTHEQISDWNAVVSAGNLSVENGQVTSVDNFSGHFRPSGKDLPTIVETAFVNFGINEAKGKFNTEMATQLYEGNLILKSNEIKRGQSTSKIAKRYFNQPVPIKFPDNKMLPVTLPKTIPPNSQHAIVPYEFTKKFNISEPTFIGDRWFKGSGELIYTQSANGSIDIKRVIIKTGGVCPPPKSPTGSKFNQPTTGFGKNTFGKLNAMSPIFIGLFAYGAYINDPEISKSQAIVSGSTKFFGYETVFSVLGRSLGIGFSGVTFMIFMLPETGSYDDLLKEQKEAIHNLGPIAGGYVSEQLLGYWITDKVVRGFWRKVDEACDRVSNSKVGKKMAEIIEPIVDPLYESGRAIISEIGSAMSMFRQKEMANSYDNLLKEQEAAIHKFGPIVGAQASELLLGAWFFDKSMRGFVWAVDKAYDWTSVKIIDPIKNFLCELGQPIEKFKQKETSKPLESCKDLLDPIYRDQFKPPCLRLFKMPEANPVVESNDPQIKSEKEISKSDSETNEKSQKLYEATTPNKPEREKPKGFSEIRVGFDKTSTGSNILGVHSIHNPSGFRVSVGIDTDGIDKMISEYFCRVFTQGHTAIEDQHVDVYGHKYTWRIEHEGRKNCKVIIKNDLTGAKETVDFRLKEFNFSAKKNEKRIESAISRAIAERVSKDVENDIRRLIGLLNDNLHDQSKVNSILSELEKYNGIDSVRLFLIEQRSNTEFVGKWNGLCAAFTKVDPIDPYYGKILTPLLQESPQRANLDNEVDNIINEITTVANKSKITICSNQVSETKVADPQNVNISINFPQGFRVDSCRRDKKELLGKLVNFNSRPITEITVESLDDFLNHIKENKWDTKKWAERNEHKANIDYLKKTVETVTHLKTDVEIWQKAKSEEDIIKLVIYYRQLSNDYGGKEAVLKRILYQLQGILNDNSIEKAEVAISLLGSLPEMPAAIKMLSESVEKAITLEDEKAQNEIKNRVDLLVVQYEKTEVLNTIINKTSSCDFTEAFSLCDSEFLTELEKEQKKKEISEYRKKIIQGSIKLGLDVGVKATTLVNNCYNFFNELTRPTPEIYAPTPKFDSFKPVKQMIWEEVSGKSGNNDTQTKKVPNKINKFSL